MSDYQKSQHSATDPSTAARGPLVPGMGSGTISTGGNGYIATESWRSTLPLFLSVTAAESRSPCGGSTVATMSMRSAVLERQDKSGGILYNTALKKVGSPFGLMRSH